MFCQISEFDAEHAARCARARSNALVIKDFLIAKSRIRAPVTLFPSYCVQATVLWFCSVSNDRHIFVYIVFPLALEVVFEIPFVFGTDLERLRFGSVEVEG